MQIDFSAAFDMVNHIKGFLYKLCSVGIGGSVLPNDSLYQTDHSTLWWMAVGVNCLTLCQKCSIAVFWARYCFPCTLRSFFKFWKII